MKIVAPWSQQRGYKGARRAKGGQPKARVGKHRRGSGFWPLTKALSPLTHKSKLFKF